LDKALSKLPASRQVYSKPMQWTAAEVGIIKEHWKMPDLELAKLLPMRTISEIRHKRNRLGLKKHIFRR